MGKSPGTGGMRPEYLKVLAEEMTNEQFHLLESFGMKYLCGNLPPWFYEVWLTVMTVPLFKTEKNDAVRPLGIRNPSAREFNKAVVIKIKIYGLIILNLNSFQCQFLEEES